MKILFIDESGVPELSSDNTNFVILSGILMAEDDEKAFSFIINQLKKKYSLELKTHIHAVDIFEGKTERNYLGVTRKRRVKDLRKDFQKDFWDIIKSFEVRYVAVKVDKTLVKKTLFKKKHKGGEFWFRKKAEGGDIYAMIDRHLPMDIAVNYLYRWAIEKLNEDDKMKIVFESRSESDQFTIRNHSIVLNNSPKHNPFSQEHVKAFARKLKKIVVSISFANKEVGFAGLEIADMVAYTCNVYFIQTKNRSANKGLINSVKFPGIHKTLKKHYKELNSKNTVKYITGLISRTKRIDKRHFRITNPLSPAKAGAQLPNNTT